MTQCIAVYPGSFDPVTFGHLDLIQRGVKIFDRLVVAVVSNPSKQPFFDLETRLMMLRETTKTFNGKIEVDSFDGLLVDFMRQKNAQVVLRGFRAVSDFEFEFEMALTNRRLAKEVETIFMAPSEEHIFLRSSLVREIAQLKGDVSAFVPPLVVRHLKERCKNATDVHQRDM